MGYSYNGPEFNTLPESIRDRIQAAAMIAQNETGALGVVVSDRTKLYGEKADPTKMWKRFGDAKEVFIYDFGGLHDAYFREGDQIFHLSFSGMSFSEDKERVEKALGLNVVKRPAHNQDEAEIRIGDKPLERLVNLGHKPNVAREDPFKYQLSASGPYMAKK